MFKTLTTFNVMADINNLSSALTLAGKIDRVRAQSDYQPAGDDESAWRDIKELYKEGKLFDVEFFTD